MYIYYITHNRATWPCPTNIAMLQLVWIHPMGDQWFQVNVRVQVYVRVAARACVWSSLSADGCGSCRQSCCGRLNRDPYPRWAT